MGTFLVDTFPRHINQIKVLPMYLMAKNQVWKATKVFMQEHHTEKCV